MVRLMFRFLTPLMFVFAVVLFLGDFRLVATAFAVAGCVSYFILQELSSRG